MNRKLKSTALVAALALSLAGCTTADQNAGVVGAAAGAVIGGATSGTLKGAAVGAAIGAGTGVLLNRVFGTNNCRYRNRNNGRIYFARCP